MNKPIVLFYPPNEKASHEISTSIEVHQSPEIALKFRMIIYSGLSVYSKLINFIKDVGDYQ
jgi:hypothetical protein